MKQNRALILYTYHLPNSFPFKQKKTQTKIKINKRNSRRGQPVVPLSWRRLNTIAPLPNHVDAWNHTHNANFSSNNNISNDIHNYL